MRELNDAFDLIAAAMRRAASACDHTIARDVATQHRLVIQDPNPMSTRHVWERVERDLTIRFQWRYYDQSHAYRTYPDMNVLSVELSQAGKILRSAEERFED